MSTRNTTENLKELLARALPYIVEACDNINEYSCPAYDGDAECICGNQADLICLKLDILIALGRHKEDAEKLDKHEIGPKLRLVPFHEETSEWFEKHTKLPWEGEK